MWSSLALKQTNQKGETTATDVIQGDVRGEVDLWRMLMGLGFDESQRLVLPGNVPEAV